MKTKAVRLYGKEDLRLEEFELPALQQDEILMKIVADSLCMSADKAAVGRSVQGRSEGCNPARSEPARQPRSHRLFLHQGGRRRYLRDPA